MLQQFLLTVSQTFRMSPQWLPATTAAAIVAVQHALGFVQALRAAS